MRPRLSRRLQEKLPEGTQVVALEALPASIELANRYAYAQLLRHRRAGQRATDRRHAGMVERRSPGGAGRLDRPAWCARRPTATRPVTFRWPASRSHVPLESRGRRGRLHPVSFVRDVMPAMSKMGCNAGTCHGSANGKNGFKLSLRGYDPLFDHRALTDDLAGRRFNRAAPDQSLMLLKPSGGVPHVGGVLTQPGEPYYELLRPGSPAA